jgi:hypothetical protein
MWTEWLEKWTPLSGRVIKEDGALENVGDLMKRQDLTTNLLSVRDGKIYQSTFRGQIGVGATLYFRQNIQANQRLRGVTLSGIFTGGIIEYQQLINSTAGNIVETLPNYNADRTKINDVDFSSTDVIQRLDGFTGGIIVDKNFGVTPDTGAGKSSASLSSIGIGGIYDANSKPYFKFTNNGNQVSEIALSWIWEEN